MPKLEIYDAPKSPAEKLLVLRLKQQLNGDITLQNVVGHDSRWSLLTIKAVDGSLVLHRAISSDLGLKLDERGALSPARD